MLGAARVASLQAHSAPCAPSTSSVAPCRLLQPPAVSPRPPARCRCSASGSAQERGAGAAPGDPSSSTNSSSRPTPPPKPVPIIHTTAYLQQTQQLAVPQMPISSTDEPAGLQQQQQQQQLDLDSNALVWALRKVDDQLNLVEQQPSRAHTALYKLSNGPVGQATSRGVQAAAKLTMSATLEAAKAAAPVGKWAIQQGFKAAAGLVGAAMEQERRQQRQQEQQRKQQQDADGGRKGRR